MSAQTASKSDLSRPAALAALVAILAVAAAIRFSHIGSKELWLDECVSELAARGSVADTVGNVARYDAHPPGYYVALNLATRVTGRGDGGVRALSALASLGCVALAYAIGAVLLGRTPALLASGALAVSSFQLYFAQEARLHALATLLVLAATLVFTLLIRADRGSRGSLWLLAAYALLVAASLYTYYYAVFAVAAHWAAFFIIWLGAARSPYSGPGRWLLTRWHAEVVLPVLFAATVVGVALFAVGWGTVLLRNLSGAAATGSTPYGPSAVTDAFRQFLLGPVADMAAPRLDRFTLVSLSVLALLPWAGGFVAARSRPGATAVLALCALIPFACVAFVARAHVFEAKHVAFVAPFAFLLIAAGWTSARARPLTLVALILLVALNAALDWAYLGPGYQKEPWRSVAHRLEATRLEGDLILANPGYAAHPLARYCGRFEVVQADGAAWPGVLLARRPGRVWLVELESNVSRPDVTVAARLESCGAVEAPGSVRVFHGFSTAPTTITLRCFAWKPARGP